MEKLIQDLRYALRSLVRQPAFTLTAVLTLALGIGATTAIFSVFNGVILKPLPFPDPDRIVVLMNHSMRTGRNTPNVSGPDFYDIEAQNQSFQAMGFFQGGEDSVTFNGTADYAQVFRVTPGFLEALGARAAIGRTLAADDHKPGAPDAAVITDGYWRRTFAGDPAAVGSTIKFNDRMFMIVGVLPPGIAHPGRADIYYGTWEDDKATNRSGHNYRAIARLREGVTLERARTDVSAVARRLAEQYPDTNATKGVALVPLQESVVGGAVESTLWVLLGAVGLVLLVACANVANLLLARASARAREMVVRAAVGAARGRLVRQLLTESAVLGIVAGLLGVWLARLGVLALVAMAPADLPRSSEVQVDATALGFALLIALVASLLFGLVPALKVSRVQLVDGLRQGGKGSSTGSKTGWARSAFVIAEVALAVVLVASAGLLGRSLLQLKAVDMGFETDRLLVLRTNVPVKTLQDVQRAIAFYRDLLTDLRAMPDLDTVSAVRGLPTDVRSNGTYWLDGRVKSLERIPPGQGETLMTVVAPNYFTTLGVPIRAGRDFTERDVEGAPMVAIVNEALAREAFGNQDPIGRLIQCGLDSIEPMTIIGVTRDVRTEGPAAQVKSELYMPFEQHPRPSTALDIVARTRSAEPLAVVEAIRRRISTANPDVPVRALTMEDTLENVSATPRFRAYLLIVFATVAMVLALAGVYGVMAYTVSQRVPELGVRIALGATPESIMKLVLAQGAKLALAGLAIGVVLSFFSGRLLEGFLFGVTPRDPMVLGGVAAGVAVAALAACYIPGRRATRVDPMIALRAE